MNDDLDQGGDYRGYYIFVSPNRDQYRCGFEWSVFKGGEGFDFGLDYSEESAQESARNAIDKLEDKPELVDSPEYRQRF